jgi:hypothetical protein
MRSLISVRGSAAATVAPEFLVTPGLLDAISPSRDSGGMVLGCSTDDEPLSVSVLRPQPTRLLVVGSLYLARQAALRAMAAGAWLVIVTGRPAAWQVLTRAAGDGSSGRLTPLVQVRPLEPAELPRASEDAPLLVVHDGGAVPQELFPRVPGRPPCTCCRTSTRRLARLRSTPIWCCSRDWRPSRPSSLLKYGSYRRRWLPGWQRCPTTVWSRWGLTYGCRCAWSPRPQNATSSAPSATATNPPGVSRSGARCVALWCPVRCIVRRSCNATTS